MAILRKARKIGVFVGENELVLYILLILKKNIICSKLIGKGTIHVSLYGRWQLSYLTSWLHMPSTSIVFFLFLHDILILVITVTPLWENRYLMRRVLKMDAHLFLLVWYPNSGPDFGPGHVSLPDPPNYRPDRRTPHPDPTSDPATLWIWAVLAFQKHNSEVLQQNGHNFRIRTRNRAKKIFTDIYGKFLTDFESVCESYGYFTKGT